MIYKRKVYNELLNWKNSKVNNSALLIEGARRIGKSTIVEEFAKNEFDDYCNCLEYMDKRNKKKSQQEI